MNEQIAIYRLGDAIWYAAADAASAVAAFLADGGHTDDLEEWKGSGPLTACSEQELDQDRVIIQDLPVREPVPTGGTFRQWLADQIAAGAQFPMRVHGIG